MGKALYRKYRSKSLDEIVGQSHITDILKRAVEKDRIAHAYLLTGPRGVGKTSIARILAHEINQLPYTDESSHLDIIEIDAASNNSVEDIRDLREKVQIAPSLAKKKIYIIDEVHMLSKSAFNALLKTLEEPPEHVVFILATTDLEKLPPTIVSRVQQFHFLPASESDIVANLKAIATKEKIKIDDTALQLIAQHSGGSFRDSVSLLDQLSHVSDGPVSTTLIESVLGLADADTVKRLLAAYESQDLATIVELLETSEQHGTSTSQLTGQLINAVQGDIVAKPHLLALLDALLEVTKSSWPRVKLLTALSAPLQTTSIIHATTPSPAHRSAPQKPITSGPKPVHKPSKDSTETKAAEVAAPKLVVAAAPIAVEIGEEMVFPWSDFLSAVREETIGAMTILSKCSYIYNGSALTVYAGKAFAKKQLEKYLPELQKCLQALGIANADIVIIGEPKPASDSQTAAVLAMMGGGEEVSL